MSVISRVKIFFAHIISGYAEVMRESEPDWHLVAKRMMYDIQLFSAEVCEIIFLAITKMRILKI